jgi:endoglucanase
MVENPIIPGLGYYGASGPINTDLAGLTSLQILDKVITAAGSIGLHIILDNHRSEAGGTAEANGLWYTDQYPETSWIYDWTFLAQRYLGNTTVIGMDLRNEPHHVGTGGACWGCGTLTNDWRLAASRGGNAILAINPSLLIFVEGTDCSAATSCTWWGGNLNGAIAYPGHPQCSQPTRLLAPRIRPEPCPAALVQLVHQRGQSADALVRQLGLSQRA